MSVTASSKSSSSAKISCPYPLCFCQMPLLFPHFGSYIYICFLRSLHSFLSADYKKIIETIEAVKYSSYSILSNSWYHVRLTPAALPRQAHEAPKHVLPDAPPCGAHRWFSRACEKIPQHNLAKRCWAPGRTELFVYDSPRGRPQATGDREH